LIALIQLPPPIPLPHPTTWPDVADHLVSSVPQIILAMGTAFTALQSWRNGRSAKIIKEQTDGQLSEIRKKNDSLHEAFLKMVAILSAREGKPIAVRPEDLAGALEEPPTHGTMATNGVTKDRRRTRDRLIKPPR
jgi:hypothetical protein